MGKNIESNTPAIDDHLSASSPTADTPPSDQNDTELLKHDVSNSKSGKQDDQARKKAKNQIIFLYEKCGPLYYAVLDR